MNAFGSLESNTLNSDNLIKCTINHIKNTKEHFDVSNKQLEPQQHSKKIQVKKHEIKNIKKETYQNIPNRSRSHSKTVSSEGT